MYISASAPDAPPFRETTIGCFIRLFFWMAACIILAIWSEAPPAPAATTISTGLVGSHAKAGAAVSANNASVLHFANFMSPPRKKAPRVSADAVGNSSRLARGRPRALGKVIERGEHAALLVRNVREREAHLDAGEGAGEHQIVEVAEVPDPEYFPRELPQTGAERHVVGFENDLAQRVGVVAGGHHHRGERVRILLGHGAQDLQAPGAYRAPRALRVARMAGEDVLQALLLEHRERFAQAVEQVGRRRVGEVAGLVVGKHLIPGPIGAREFRRLRRLARLFAHAIERQAGRQHQAFLRAGDGDVDAPLVVAVVDRGKRRYGI